MSDTSKAEENVKCLVSNVEEKIVLWMSVLVVRIALQQHFKVCGEFIMSVLNGQESVPLVQK